MNDAQQSPSTQPPMTRFAYRLIYLRPRRYSDERIAVGLVADGSDRLEARFASSVGALDMLARIVGTDGVEQFHFAAAELRRSIVGRESVEELTSPTDAFVLGERINAVTLDRSGLLSSALSCSSSLISTDPVRSSEILTAPAVSLTRDLFEQVSRLNPLVAQDMFNKKVRIEGDLVELPICGTRIFGAPVSFAAGNLRMKAESYVAKFVWLREYLTQQPRVYLLTPQEGSSEASGRLESNIRELRAIAGASRVPLKTSESTEEMATLIIQEEAA